MWKLESELFKENGGRDQNTRTVRSTLTLNDDFDYVKGIAYSSYGKVLFSTADNGIVRKWDLN